jgi:hypothetical protein
VTPIAGAALLAGIIVFGWAAPTSYRLFKMLHVVAAVVWVGGGALVVLAFGIAMIEKGDLGYGEFWIVAALVGWGLTFLTGVGFFAPQTKKLNALIEQHGVEHPTSQAQLKKILLVARLDVAMLLLITADMAAKPFA